MTTRMHPSLDRLAAGDRPAGSLHIVVVLPTLTPYGGVISVVNMLERLYTDGHRYTLASMSQLGESLLHTRSEAVHVTSPGELASQPLGRVDLVVATSWETVPYAHAMMDAHPDAKAAYFVQDIEADFYRDAETKQAALATYGTMPVHIVKTRYLADRLAGLGVDARLIRPGMDLDVFYPRDVAPPAHGRLLAMARPGTDADHRGFDVLVDVLAQLARRRPALEVALFGSDGLEDHASRLPAGFESLGRLSPDRLPVAYARASVFLETSRRHGFGRTGVEAMACGTPCVLSRSGGPSEYAVDGDNALLVDVGDVAGTVAAVERVLDDPALASRLAEAGRRTVSRYDDRLAAYEFLAAAGVAVPVLT